MNYFVWKATTKTEWAIVETNVKNNKKYSNQIISVYPYSTKVNESKEYVYGGLATSKEELDIFKKLISDCDFVVIDSEEKDYDVAEASLAENVEKLDDYIIVRSEYGKIESLHTSFSHLIRKYGNAVIAKNQDKNMLDNFVSNKTFTGKENRTQNCSVIPTLFKLDKSSVRINGTKIIIQFERIYDDNVVLKYLKKGAVFNAFLPYIGEDKSDTNTTYTFVDNSGNDISFVLPSQMSTRMLYLQLDEMQKGFLTDIDTKIYLIFNKDASYSKGYVNFNNMTIDDFNQLQITDESDESIKTIYLYDGQMDYTFKFSCYTKNLPIPALSDGLFAYVDGSSLKTGKEKESYGTGVVLSQNNTVRFCHSEGAAKGSNFIGEVQAVTELLKELSNMSDEDTTVRIFFDNTAVGYYPHGLFDWKEQKKDDEHKYVVAYKETLDKFVENHPSIKLVFEHLDAHCKIFGNEFADRIAKVENTEVEDDEVAPGYFEKRKIVCANEGIFSDSFKTKK
ncbi:RNase H family protein [Pseudobutyrivibrio ruminis]|uniref:RNase H n=1 Tax=Pseudobutyrivibrio ruminis DSM 9787 TaxID=1123011 RepID=A0A285T8B7_9FIRM|nr:RNase H family protein [Pseudobutyrivibrio ruminis]SOC17748.1 RNase H [Pseudobutyrivibrio ruminis DSM 9787]